MERTAATDVDADACPCCGVMVAGEWLDIAGACELCCDYPFTLAWTCCKLHGDMLRLDLVARVERGMLTPLGAVALAAADDAHRAGHLREVRHDARWIRHIVEPAPDPLAWDRLSRMRDVDGTIQRVVRMFVGDAATQPWNAAKFRQLLNAGLSALSRRAGSSGIWRIEVASPTEINIEPPTDYIQADTTASRRRDTIDGLVREVTLT